jgi:hypothetical protein
MIATNKGKEALISQEMLKGRIHYDRETGVFTWLDVKVNAKRARNKRAGCINVEGYVQIGFRLGGKGYALFAHRLAWLYEYGEFPSGSLDHINHNKTDNRVTNLRIATNRENCRNQSMSSNNTTGHTGVTFRKASNKYYAHIRVNYKQKHLGCFENIEDAAKAVKEARAHYGFHVNHGQTND